MAKKNQILYGAGVVGAVVLVAVIASQAKRKTEFRSFSYRGLDVRANGYTRMYEVFIPAGTGMSMEDVDIVGKTKEEIKKRIDEHLGG